MASAGLGEPLTTALCAINLAEASPYALSMLANLAKTLVFSVTVLAGKGLSVVVSIDWGVFVA